MVTSHPILRQVRLVDVLSVCSPRPLFVDLSGQIHNVRIPALRRSSVGSSSSMTKPPNNPRERKKVTTGQAEVAQSAADRSGDDAHARDRKSPRRAASTIK